MKKALILTVTVLCFRVPARAADEKGNISREQAVGIAEMITQPVKDVVRPAALEAGRELYEALQFSFGAEWALWDLLNGMAAKQKAGAAPEPDPALAETYLRLRMRCNTSDLCGRLGGCRQYPGPAAFGKAAELALKDVNAFAAGLKNRSPLSRPSRTRIQSHFETARKRVIFQLPVTKEPGVKPPPAGPEEEKYRQVALSKRQGDKFIHPPWP